MDLSRDECVTLRDRMRARGIDSSSASINAEEPSAVDQKEPVARGRYSPPRHRPEGQGPLPASNAVSSMTQVKSLKERVYDRAAAPTRTPSPLEAVKDVYVHEQPFPVSAVYEVERVRSSRYVSPTRGSGGSGGDLGLKNAETTNHGDTLLMPEDAARLVSSLEDRLQANLKRVAALENELLLGQSEHRDGKMQLEIMTAENRDLTARNQELERQLAVVRGESRDIIEAGNRQNERVVQTAIDANNKKWSSVERGMQAEIQSLRTDLTETTRTKLELDRLVRELKEQLAQNAGSLQTGNDTVRDLTKQLLAAKLQSSSISNGYRDLEKQVKSTNALCHSQKSELEALRNVHTELVAEREIRKRHEEDLEQATRKLDVWKDAEQERQRLEQVTRVQATEMQSKQKELEQLKEQLDGIKDQAHQAYLQSNRFHRMTAAGGGGGGLDASMMGGGYGDDPMAHLRREIEDEERRTSEESRRWRTKLSSPMKL